MSYIDKDFEKFISDIDDAAYKKYLIILIDKCGVDKYTLLNNIIQIDWKTGGLTGGNCWGDRADQPVDPEKEPEFEMLDKIIENFMPEISYFQYKRIRRDCVIEEDKTINEYYGNYIYKSVKRFDFKKFYYEFLAK